MNPSAAAIMTALALALPAQALSQHFPDDRLMIYGSAFRTDSRISLEANGRARTEAIPFSAAWNADGTLQDHNTQPHWQVRLRLTDRQRILGGHYEVNQARRYEFAETLGSDWIPGEQIELTSEAGFQIDFELANVMYEFAVLDTERWMVGVAAGVYWLRLEAWADATVVVDYEDETRSEAADFDWVRRRHAPAVGARVAYAPGDRWLLGVELQGFATNWGNFASEDGHFERASLSAVYRLTPMFGVHAGYDWFLLDLSGALRGDLLGGEVTFSGRARGEIHVHGPTLGILLSF